jgi:folate-binding protein YgfZ
LNPVGRYRAGPASLVEIAGRDRERFLQGQCTNDILALPPSGVARAAALTPKGKLLADFRVARRDPLRLLCPWGRSEFLAAHLKKYAVFQDVRIESSEGTFAIVEIYGEPGGIPLPAPGAVAPAVLAGVSLEVWPPYFETSATWLLSAADLPALERALSETAQPVSDEDAEILRIEAGRPAFGRDIDESNLPDEVGMDDAISTTKGCYVGQEIVARLRTYGRVNRRLVGFSFDAGWLPAVGTALVRPGQTEKDAARVTSAGLSPRLGPIGLGFAVREVSDGETLASAGDPSLTARVAPVRRAN